MANKRWLSICNSTPFGFFVSQITSLFSKVKNFKRDPLTLKVKLCLSSLYFGLLFTMFGRYKSMVKSISKLPVLVGIKDSQRSEEHTSELQSRPHLVCRLLLEKKNK